MTGTFCLGHPVHVFYKHNDYKHIQAQIGHFLKHMLSIYPSLGSTFVVPFLVPRKDFQETCKKGLKNSNLFAFVNYSNVELFDQTIDTFVKYNTNFFRKIGIT